MGQLQKIFEYLGCPKDDTELQTIIDKVADRPTRKNVGKQGRGQTAFSMEQKDRIKFLARYYKDINFARIGL